MKTLFLKTYNENGTFNIIQDVSYTNFTKAINSGLQELSFILARKIDEFNSSNEFDLNMKVQIEVFDDDVSGEGLIIYSGYITEQNPIISGSLESVKIICSGYFSKLSTDILKSGSQTELYTKATDGLTATSGDISTALVSDVVRAVLTYYNTNNNDSEIEVLTIQDGGEASIETTTNYMKMKFSGKTYSEVLDICKELAPPNWFWYIGADNVFRFKQKPETATHNFSLGKNIKSINVEKNIQTVYNVILLWGYDDDGTSIAYKEYKDDASISLYGRRVMQKTLYNVKDEETLDNLGASILEESKDPQIKITLEVIDNNENNKGYDIDSIEPGDTCKITNLAEGDLFNSNMFITSVNWSEYVAKVNIEYKIQNLEKYLNTLQRVVEETDLQGLPSSYT
jgi:hypothetical protein